MTVTLLTPDELTSTERESLWSQGVSLDDWDYLVLAPVDTIASKTCVDAYDHSAHTIYEQQEYLLEKLLTGACDNRWYKATFRGAEYALGIAYHA